MMVKKCLPVIILKSLYTTCIKELELFVGGHSL